MSFLDLRCTICKICPSELYESADSMTCEDCIDKNIFEKNPYLGHGKFPFTTLYVEKNERFAYLKEIQKFVDIK